MSFKLNPKSLVPLDAGIVGYLRTLIMHDKYRKGERFFPKEVQKKRSIYIQGVILTQE